MNPVEDKPKLNIIVLMTLGVSLRMWHTSGQASREANHYKRLANKGHSLSLLTYGKHDLEYSPYWSPINILPWIGRINHFIKYSFIAAIYHWRAFRSANIVKSNQSPGSLVGLVGRLINPSLKWVVRCGWVGTKDALIAEGKTGWLLKRALFAEWLAFKTCDAIIVTTQSDANYVIDAYNIKPHKLNVIPNSVDVEVLSYKQKTPDFTDTIKLLLVGRLAEMKNFHLVFEAVHQFPNRFEISLIGSGDYRPTLERSAKELKLNIRFLGNLANDQLTHQHHSHDLVVMTEAWGSGMPKVVLEAMATGTPFLASNIRSVRQFVEDGVNGFICEPDTASIHAGLRRIVEFNAVDLDQMRQRARRDIELKYSMDSCIESEIDLFHNLLST
ncbi:MAG: glycosyltransferase family 4 protein [Proteobacteria bacterium]|nr:glycosyltransferase family 4 protein [Pseudomonadota bacterium]